MDIQDRRREALRELHDRIAGIQQDDDSVLGVSTETVFTIELACGGPSAWIEYHPDTDSAKFCTTAPGYEHSAGVTEIVMSSDEIDEIRHWVES